MDFTANKPCIYPGLIFKIYPPGPPSRSGAGSSKGEIV